jgi:very-short-patch-repair endonuclease
MVDYPEEEKIYRDKYRLYRKKLKKYSCKNLLKPTPSASGAEAILQKIVQNIFFFKLSKEVVFEPYIVDFVISHAAVKIGIEIDGSVHDRQQNYDEERDQILLQKYALPIYRFKNDDVQTSNFIKAIWASCYQIYEVRIAQVNSIANKYNIEQMHVKV